MKKTSLVIMAAGIGSRFGGGIKQLEAVGPNGEIIMDYSIHDALEAGFDKIVFIIRKDLEKDFKEIIGNRIEKIAPVEYAFQEMDDLPEGFSVPEGRVKPWGTGHAVLSAIDVIDGPFAVINADDYYGRHAFEAIYNFLSTTEDDDKYRYTMVGYALENTLTENGHVARGVCVTDENHYLTGITERTHIEKRGSGAAYTEDDGQTWVELPMDVTVSMNMWGFSMSFLKELKAGFPDFLTEAIKTNPLKGEYFLPTAVNNLISEDRATVTVLKSLDKWYGVTYKEDKAVVVDAIRKMEEDGLYPFEF